MALRSLPKGLDATYEYILQHIPEEYKKRAHKALLLLSGPEHISFEEPDVLAEAVIVDIDELLYHEEDRIVQPEEFLRELCTCLIRIDEENPRLKLAHYTVKEYLYSDRIKSSNVGNFHCSTESAAFFGSIASITYLLNISYDGVPSAQEYYTATASQQQEYEKEVKKTFPFLDVADTVSWGYDELIKDQHPKQSLDHLLVQLFQPSKPQFLWWEWRAIKNSGSQVGEHLHPVWENWEGLEANAALSIACFLRKPNVAALILQNNPGLLCCQQRLILDPAYSEEWADFFRQPSSTTDVIENTFDYLPGGTPLEVVLRLDSIDCVELIVQRTPNISQYIYRVGLSALSVAIKAQLVIFQDDFRVENTEVLLKAGADPNLQPVSETPLQSAAKLLHIELIAVLLEAGALVNEVADDAAIMNSINQNFEGSAEEKREAIRCRGFGNGYKTPLRIVLDEIGEGNTCEEAEILRRHGGLSLCLFPVADLPGYQSEDWTVLEESNSMV
jgi:hypothetical protein